MIQRRLVPYRAGQMRPCGGRISLTEALEKLDEFLEQTQIHSEIFAFLGGSRCLETYLSPF